MTNHSPDQVAPEVWNLTAEKIGPELRRAFVLIAKILQYIANGILSPDSAAQWVNPFIQANIPNCSELLEEFAQVPADAPVVFVNRGDMQGDLLALHSLCFEFRTKIEDWLKETGDNKALKVAAQFSALLTRLGAPRELPVRERRATALQASAAKSTANNEAFSSFMQRMTGASLAEIEGKQLLIEVGRTLDGTPCYQYVARRFQPSFNVDALLYFLLKTVGPGLARPWSIIVDLTLFSPEHQVPVPWLIRYATIVPPSLRDNLQQIFLLNPNKQFKDYSKRLSRVIPTHKIVICGNVGALDKFIARAESKLPPATLRLDAVQATFQAVRVTQYKVAKDLTFKLTQDAVELVASKPASLYGTNVQLREFYSIGGLESVKQHDDFQFSLKFDREPKTVTYKAPSCTQLVQALKAQKARFDLTAHAGVKTRLRPADLPGTLLNMAFLNAQHTNTSLRGQAYNLLAALCNSFDFVAREKLLELQGLSIPQENSRFVVEMSSLLAKTEPQITLEFLTEAINTLQTGPVMLKGYMMLYMQPWLSNLDLFAHNQDNPTQIAKTSKILLSLLQWTIQEEGFKSVVCARVWETLGSVPGLLETIVKLCLREACAHPQTVPTIADVMCSLAVHNSTFIAGKMIASTLKALRRTNDRAIETLSDHPLWPNITVYLRIMLWLSFNGRLCVTKYLPEIFHIIICTASIGDSLTRNTVHALSINSLHSLFTELSSGFQAVDSGDLQKLYHSIDALNQRSIHLVFGISAILLNPFTVPAAAQQEKVVERLDIGNVETIASALFTALCAASPEGKAHNTPWHGRWMTLTTEAAMRKNPVLQARAFVTFGVLAAGSRRIITTDLLMHILATLESAILRNIAENMKILTILETSILSCLTRMVPTLDLETTIVRQLFWLGCSLMALNQEGVFKASVRLIDELIKTFDADGVFDLNSMSSFFMTNRKRLESSLKKLDEITGINFRHSFDFALMTHLVKGVRQQSTKPLTISFISTTLTTAAKSETPDALLGYMAMLLLDQDRFDLDQVAPWAKGKDLSDVVWSKMVCPDPRRGALLFALLSSLVRSSVNEREKALLYKTIAVGLTTLPQAAPVVSNRLFPLLNQIIQRSQNPEMTGHVLSIVEALPLLIMEPKTFAEFKQGTLPEATLDSTGFGQIFHADKALVETDSGDRHNVVVRKVVAHLIKIMLTDEADMDF